jgi:hypothetical protein
MIMKKLETIKHNEHYIKSTEKELTLLKDWLIKVKDKTFILNI